MGYSYLKPLEISKVSAKRWEFGEQLLMEASRSVSLAQV
jgi:hypothetical protein